MAVVVVTLKIMPDSPDTNLDSLAESATEKIAAFGGKVGRTIVEPVAFGLKSLTLLFTMQEDKGSTDSLETDISQIEGVTSVQVTDVRRVVG